MICLWRIEDDTIILYQAVRQFGGSATFADMNGNLELQTERRQAMDVHNADIKKAKQNELWIRLRKKDLWQTNIRRSLPNGSMREMLRCCLRKLLMQAIKKYGGSVRLAATNGNPESRKGLEAKDVRSATEKA